MVYSENHLNSTLNSSGHSCSSIYRHIRSRRTFRSSILLIGRIHEFDLKIVVARTQDSVLAQDLKPKVCRPNLDNKLEIGLPVFLLHLPELSVLEFHVAACQFVFDQDNLFAAGVCGPVWQLVWRVRRHYNLRVPGALMVVLCKGRCIGSGDAVSDADFFALLDEPTGQCQQHHQYPQQWGRLTRLRSSPIGGCRDGPP
jgi:hypothetical protein